MTFPTLTTKVFLPHTIQPGRSYLIDLRHYAPDTKPAQTILKMDALKKKFYSESFLNAQKALIAISGFQPFTETHAFRPITHIYFLFLQELIERQLNEFPEHENNKKLEDLFLGFQDTYGTFEKGRERESCIRNQLIAFSEQFLCLLYVDKNERNKLKNIFEFYFGLLIDPQISNMQLQAFYDSKLKNFSEWKLEHTKKGAKHFFDIPTNIPPIKISAQILVTYYQQTVKEMIEVSSFAKRDLEIFPSFVSKLVEENKNSEVYKLWSDNWMCWDKEHGQIFIKTIDQLISQFSIHQKAFRENSKQIDFFDEKDALKSLVSRAIGILNPSNLAWQKNNYEMPSGLEYLQRYVKNRVCEIYNFINFHVLTRLLFLNRFYQSLNEYPENIKVLKSISVDESFNSAYAPLNLKKLIESQTEEILYQELTRKVDKSKKGKQRQAASSAPIPPPSAVVVKEKKKIVPPQPSLVIKKLPVLQQITTLGRTREVALRLLDRTRRLPMGSAKQIHATQMYWHFQQLELLKESSEHSKEILFSHYLLGATHSGWILEQALYAELNGEVPQDVHHLIKLAEQVKWTVDPVLKQLYLVNNWEKYPLEYERFCKKSSFFYKDEATLSPVLKIFAAFFNNPDKKIESEYLREKMVTLISEVTEWVEKRVVPDIIDPQEKTKNDDFNISGHRMFACDKKSFLIRQQEFKEICKNLEGLGFLTYSQLNALFSVFNEVLDQLDQVDSFSKHALWSIQLIRCSQNLISELLTAYYVMLKKEKSLHLHRIPALAADCGLLGGWDVEQFEGLSVKSRYPVQSDSKGLGARLIDGIQSLLQFPEQQEGFTPIFNKNDLWELPIGVTLEKINADLERFYTETLKGLERILHGFSKLK